MAYNKEEIYEILKEKGFAFDVVEHIPVFTMEEMEKEIQRDTRDIVKNAFLRDEKKKHWYLVLMEKDKSLDMNKLREKLGSSRLSFAREDYLKERLGVGAGAVSPLAILHDVEHKVEVLLDEDLARHELVGVHPCDNTATVFMKTRDLEQLIRDNGNSIKKISI